MDNSQEQRNKVINYKRVFGTPEGKEVLYDLINNHYVLSTHKGDAYCEGQRKVVLEILNKCNVNIEAFDKMLKGEDNV